MFWSYLVVSPKHVLLCLNNVQFSLCCFGSLSFLILLTTSARCQVFWKIFEPDMRKGGFYVNGYIFRCSIFYSVNLLPSHYLGVTS